MWRDIDPREPERVAVLTAPQPHGTELADALAPPGNRVTLPETALTHLSQ